MAESDLDGAGRGLGVADGNDAPRRGLIFIVVSIALFMVAVDQTIVATALPAIQDDLHARINWAAWTITIYSLGQVLVMPVAGKLSDQFGRKNIFLYAIGLFTLASLLCGIANSIGLLIVFRALQSVGGGAFVPSASGIVADQFGPNRDRALAMFTSILPIGGIFGPVLGGFFVIYWSWRGIFFINVPIGIALMIFCILIVPANGHRERVVLDVAGVGLLGAMDLAVMFGFTYLGANAVSMLSWQFLVPEAIGVSGAILFVRHIRSSQWPIIPSRLLYGHGFGIMNFINFVYGGAVLGLASVVPLYAEERYRLMPIPAGTLLTARAVGMIALAGLASFALRRSGPRRPMAGGFALISLGLVLLSLAPVGIGPYEWLAAGAAFTGLGMGLAVPATNNASLQLAPEHVAAIVGLRGMFRQSGSILALSVTTALLARSEHPAAVQSHIFLTFAVLMLLLIPMNLLVPDHRGSW